MQCKLLWIKAYAKINVGQFSENDLKVTKEAHFQHTTQEAQKT